MSAVVHDDRSSPDAYLAAARIDRLLPDAVWRPIPFGHLLRHTGRVPVAGAGPLAPVRRARPRAPPPAACPRSSTRPAGRATATRSCRCAPPVHADREGRVREFTLAAYAIAFHEGPALDEAGPLMDAANRAGLDPEALRAALDDPEVEDRLRRHTGEAIALGVEGVPTVTVDGARFWGDDRLEDAAHAATPRR